MAVSMVGEMNPYELFNVALLAPESELMAVLQGKSDKFPQDIAFSALKKQRQMKTAVQGVKAQDELSGVAGLPTDNMMGMAGGGIVAFDHGGTIHGQAGFFVGPNGEVMTAEQLAQAQRGVNPNRRLPTVSRTAVGPYDPAARFPSVAAPEAEGLFGRMFKAIPGRLLGAVGLGTYAPELSAGTLVPEDVNLSPEERGTRAKAVVERLTPELQKVRAELAKAGASKFDSSLGSSRMDALRAREAELVKNISDAQKFTPKIAYTNQGPAAPAASGIAAAPIENLLDYPSVPALIKPRGKAAAGADKTSVAAAAAAAPAAAPAIAPTKRLEMTERDGLASLIPDNQQTRPASSRNFASYLGDFSGQTKEYIDKMTAAMEALTPTAEEKERQGSERKGVMALKAAQALLKPGTTGEGARGSALGEIADLTAAYAKEDNADRKAMIGAKINMFGAQAQLAQGNAKAAADAFQHAERLAFEGIKLDNERWFQSEKLKLEDKKLLNDDTYHKLLIQAKNRETDMLGRWHQDQVKALNDKGLLTPLAKAQLKQKMIADAIDSWDKLGPAGQMNKNRDKYIADSVNQGMRYLFGEAEVAAPPSGRQFDVLPGGGGVAGAVKLP